jgi:hypothetical protein
MKQTSHYKFKQYEGADLFNPLTVEAQNIQDIDAGMYANKTAAVQSATEVKSGTVHAITRTVPGASVIKFVATSNWTAGDTCTVDGIQVTALLTTGETLPTGAWKINASVLAILNGTVLTVFTSTPSGGGTEIDADTLNGHDAAYFMSREDGAVKSVGIKVLLNNGNWTQSGTAYAQTVAAAGVTATTNIVTSPSADGWAKSQENNVRCTAQAAGTLTFTADSIPDASIYFNVIILG